MQAQAEHQIKWSQVDPEDPAYVLYDPKCLFEEQVKAAKELLGVCPKVKSVLCGLCRECLPREEELVVMGKEVAAQKGAVASLAQRLLDGEQKAHCALLTTALHILLNDRNASALLQCNPSLLRSSDDMLAMAIQVTTSPTNFEKLRNFTTKNYPPLTVRAVPPTLPGSSALRRVLPISTHAIDAMAEMRKLQTEHEGGLVGKMVDIIHQDQALLVCFFTDAIRAAVKHGSSSVCVEVAEWVLPLAKSLHHSIFKKDPTIWSICALCTVEHRIIEDYITAFVPLVEMGVLECIPPGKGLSGSVKRDLSWVEVDFSCDLLVQALPSCAGCRVKLLKYRSACMTVVNRGKPRQNGSGKLLPALSIVCCVISCHSPTAVFPLQEAAAFLAASRSAQQPRVHLPTLRALLNKAPSATGYILKSVVKYVNVLSVDPALIGFVLDLIGTQYVTRSMACYVMSHLPCFSEKALTAETASALLTAAEKQKGSSKIGKNVVYAPPGVGSPTGTLSADVYLALFDMTFDTVIGVDCEHATGRAAIEVAEQIVVWREAVKSTEGAMLLSNAVQLAAMEQAFVRLLALAFVRPPESPPSWTPPCVSNPNEADLLSSVAHSLMEPANFQCPARGSEQDRNLFKNPVDPTKDAAILCFLSTLETGLGPMRGMGTKAMLEYLRSQVAEEAPSMGPIVRVCGQATRHKCQNAEPLATKPGDLPFIYKIQHPLHDLYLSFKRVLQNSSDMNEAQAVSAVISGIESVVHGSNQEKARLVLYYSAFRCYFAESVVYPHARVIVDNTRIKTILSLGHRQARVLLVAFDFTKAGSYCEGDPGILNSLSEGFKNDWVEMVITAAAVGCAVPGSFLGTMLLDADGLCEKFIPGDKTGSSVAHGGCFKFDCVTQLDESGNIDSCAKGQPVLSTGACYLLWGLEFGLLALQLVLFPETHPVMWEWLFSATLHTRMYEYQQGLSDFAHMVNQLTERSIAYHLHMGAHTGLTIDEAQRVYAFFLSHLLEVDDVSSPLRQAFCSTRDEALSVEKCVENFWKSCVTSDRNDLVRPETDMCHTVKAVSQWASQTAGYILPRGVTAIWSLETIGTDAKPKVLSMLLEECTKLSILPLLIMDLVEFGVKVHLLLSGRLQYRVVRNKDEVLTPLRGVLKILKEQVPQQRYAEMVGLLKRLKGRWNAYRNNVGAIDFECEAGGINILMDEHESDPPTHSDTLDFWVVYNTSTPPDPDHKNLLQAALTALIDKYNACVDTLSGHLSITPRPADPSSVPKSSLLLPLSTSLTSLIRCHVQGSPTPDWASAEAEVLHLYSYSIPRLEVPHIPVFTYLPPPEPLEGSVVMDTAKELVASSGSGLARLSEPIPEQLLGDVEEAIGALQGNELISTLDSLVSLYKSKGVPGEACLYSAMAGRGEVWISERLTNGLLVSNALDVIRIGLNKAEDIDLAKIGGNPIGDGRGVVPAEYNETPSTDIIDEIQTRVMEHRASGTRVAVIDELTMLISALEDTMGNTGYLTPDEDIASFIAAILLSDADDVGPSSGLYIVKGVPMKHLHWVTEYLSGLKRSLQDDGADTWAEDGAGLGKEGCLETRLECLVVDSQLKVVGVRGGMDRQAVGMVIHAVNGDRIRSKEQLAPYLSSDAPCTADLRPCPQNPHTGALFKSRASIPVSLAAEHALPAHNPLPLSKNRPAAATYSYLPKKAGGGRLQPKESSSTKQRALHVRFEQLTETVHNLKKQLQVKERLLSLNREQTRLYSQRVDDLMKEVRRRSLP
eukprot:TRINITY_DN620_c0_g2_i1.p1 TRINITY_DN620_c0_g2~~TRINITY_DN620_c0_g2_i1.p1  ORF type:complete len:1760 (+),score=275.49 TRINITY_DN620_c0_g2_i1:300-5579(+)